MSIYTQWQDLIVIPSLFDGDTIKRWKVNKQVFVLIFVRPMLPRLSLFFVFSKFSYFFCYLILVHNNMY